MRSLLLAAALAASTLASAQVLDSRTFSTEGHPVQAIWTPDGQHVLVTVANQRGSGIEVFRVEGDKLKRETYQPIGNENAQGILLIPHTGLLAVGLSNVGVAFLPLDATLKGKATPRAISQGDRPGSGYLAVTPDGSTLFVANEYGQGGNVGVIACAATIRTGSHPQPPRRYSRRTSPPRPTAAPCSSPSTSATS